jgi:hypothetical protein
MSTVAMNNNQLGPAKNNYNGSVRKFNDQLQKLAFYDKIFWSNFRDNIQNIPKHVQTILIQYLFFDLFSKKMNFFFPTLTKILLKEFTIVLFPYVPFAPTTSAYHDMVKYLLFIDEFQLNECPILQEIYKKLKKYSLPLSTASIFRTKESFYNPFPSENETVTWDFHWKNLNIVSPTTQIQTEQNLKFLLPQTQFVYLDDCYELIFMQDYKLQYFGVNDHPRTTLSLVYRVKSAIMGIKTIRFDFRRSMPYAMEHIHLNANYYRPGPNSTPFPRDAHSGLREYIIDPKHPIHEPPKKTYKAVIFGFWYNTETNTHLHYIGL